MVKVNYFEEIQRQFGNAGATAALRVMKLCADARAGRFDKRRYIALAQQCARSVEQEELLSEIYAKLLELKSQGKCPVGDTIFTRIFAPRETHIAAKSVSIDEEDENGYSLADRLPGAVAVVEFEDPVERAQEEQNMLDWHDSPDLRREIVNYAVKNKFGARQTLENDIRRLVKAAWEVNRRRAIRNRGESFDYAVPSGYATADAIQQSRVGIKQILIRVNATTKAQILEAASPTPDAEGDIKKGLIAILAPICRSAAALKKLFDLSTRQLFIILRYAANEVAGVILGNKRKQGKGRIFKITKKFIAEAVRLMNDAAQQIKNILDAIRGGLRSVHSGATKAQVVQLPTFAPAAPAVGRGQPKLDLLVA